MLEFAAAGCDPAAVLPDREMERRLPKGGPEGDGEGSLQGTIERITYRDERSLYTVLKLSPEGASAARGQLFAGERVSAVGKPVEIAEGLRVRLGGRWTSHPQHGWQFEFSSCEVLTPLDELGLVRYLASPLFNGIGETLAKRIVKKLGSGALERIQADPGVLQGIKGLQKKVAAELCESLRSQASRHHALAFLRGLGLGPLQSQNALADLGAECESQLRANPYRLAQVHGMGFLTADRIALQLGLSAGDPRRLAAALLHLLESAREEGHCALPVAGLNEAARTLLRLEVARSDFDAVLLELEQSQQLVIERALLGLSEPCADAALVYLPWLYTCERGVAQSILRLTAGGEVPPLASAAELDRLALSDDIRLHVDQRQAILALLSTPLGLLTGGPGVGKTTIVRLIAALAEHAGHSVALASPTGRAAKRLAEATGRPASTIHRLLGYQAQGGGFEHNAERPLAASLIIVDEISMLDIALAHHLLKAIAAPTRLLLVGDPDQLPSVGPGSVLRDLLNSGRLAVSRLTHIWRQARGSLIIENAHAIRAGQPPVFPERGDVHADFYFFPAEEPEVAAERVVEVVTNRIPRTFGLDWTRDVQVIAPMYRGACGVDQLNERLREAQGCAGREVVRGSERWRTGDRVIQTRNDYDKEVFNGDMGRIIDVSAEGLVTVRYPEQDVVYAGSELGDLRPAYAITVHRSQGAEFAAVVLPLLTQQRIMLRRNLLYTAVTRAKKLVVLVGSLRALQIAIDDNSEDARHSALALRLGC